MIVVAMTSNRGADDFRHIGLKVAEGQVRIGGGSVGLQEIVLPYPEARALAAVILELTEERG